MSVNRPMATFETPLGRCGLSWNEWGITRVELPGLATVEPPAGNRGAAPPFVRTAIDAIAAVLAGERSDLGDVPLDERAIDPFRRSVHAATRTIGPGTTATYGQVARMTGRTDPEAARDVGAALARNPFPIIVPCHRVVAADGALRGFSGPGGLETKRRMLELEGAPGYGQQRLFG